MLSIGCLQVSAQITPVQYFLFLCFVLFLTFKVHHDLCYVTLCTVPSHIIAQLSLAEEVYFSDRQQAS